MEREGEERKRLDIKNILIRATYMSWTLVMRAVIMCCKHVLINWRDGQWEKNQQNETDTARLRPQAQGQEESARDGVMKARFNILTAQWAAGGRRSGRWLWIFPQTTWINGTRAWPCSSHRHCHRHSLLDQRFTRQLNSACRHPLSSGKAPGDLHRSPWELLSFSSCSP